MLWHHKRGYLFEVAFSGVRLGNSLHCAMAELAHTKSIAPMKRLAAERAAERPDA